MKGSSNDILEALDDGLVEGSVKKFERNVPRD